MNTTKSPDEKKRILTFLALLPHRDSARVIEEYRGRLFSAGFAGAYSFPAVVPLALVSRTFDRDELKAAARTLRELSLFNGGKITTRGSAETPWPAAAEEAALGGRGRSFFGLRLDLPWEEKKGGGEKFMRENPKIVFRFPLPILCAAVVGGGFLIPEETRGRDLPHAPVLRFTAAAAANLCVRFGGNEKNFLEWKLSAPVWLPAPAKKKNGKLLRS